ncbi:MAG: hypothetical protein WC686_04945 [Candidatus Shapirobacteria bacterium]|jgi:hypothetical protein
MVSVNKEASTFVRFGDICEIQGRGGVSVVTVVEKRGLGVNQLFGEEKAPSISVISGTNRLSEVRPVGKKLDLPQIINGMSRFLGQRVSPDLEESLTRHSHDPPLPLP